MQQMITIRLLEVKGFACTQNGSAKDANEPLKQAHDQLLQLICSNGGIEPENLTNIAKTRILNTTAQDSVIKAEARILFQLCIKAVAQIPAETFNQLIQTMVLNEEDIELLKRNASEWKSQLNPNTPLTDTDVEELRNHKLALTADQLKSVYLAEQLASILYTRGRLMFYKGFDPKSEDKHIKMIKLAHYVSQQVFKHTGVRLLHLLISETNGTLYVKLEQKYNTDEEKIKGFQ
uniref:Uncharacterized protein n=1 Tax=Ciona savignyi TaxID=51511 RepID=H2ZNB3_CIOSA